MIPTPIVESQLILPTMLRIEVEDDRYAPRVFSRRTSSCTFSWLPSQQNGTLPRRSFSYCVLPQQPLILSVLKLDGSCFDIEVPSSATVAVLKHAVESVFSHFPQKGPGKISWPHVWGQFCLCFHGHKLLVENEYIRNYGIRDGDQLQFTRHVSIAYDIPKRRPRKRESSSTTKLNMFDKEERMELFEGDEDGYEDLENPNFDQFEGGYHYNKKFEFKRSLTGWFSYSRLPRTRRINPKGSHSSRFSSGFLNGLRRIIRIYSEKCF